MVGLVATAGVIGGCRSNKAPDKSAPEADPTPVEAPVVIPALPLGLASPEAFSLAGEPGHKSYRAALMAQRARDVDKELAALRKTLSQRPDHFEASWLLGMALARAGQHRDAVVPLLQAAAADFARYGHLAESSSLLTPLREAHPEFTESVAALRKRFDAALASGEWVVAQLARPRTTDRTGPVSLESGAEAFVQFRAAEAAGSGADTPGGNAATAPVRFFRASLTRGAVRGLAAAPDGKRAAFVAARNQWRPTAAERAKGKRTIMRDIEIGIAQPGQGGSTRIALGNAWAVELWWTEAPDSKLVIRAYRADDQQRPQKQPRLYRADVAAGKLVPLDLANPEFPGADKPPASSGLVRVELDSEG